MKNPIKLTASEKKSLFVTEVKAISSEIRNNDLTRFENSESQAQFVCKAHLWFKTASAKELMVREGGGIKDVIEAAYPFKKAMYYHLLEFGKFANENPQMLKDWKREVLKLKEQKLAVSLSTMEYVKYYKEAKLETGEGEGEGEAPEVKAKAQTEIVFTFKGEAFNLANVSLRVTGGEVKTEATKEAVNEALAFLYDLVNEAPKVTEAKAKKKAKAEHKAATKKGLTIQDVVIVDEVNFAD